MGTTDDGETFIKAATLNKLIIKLTNDQDHGIQTSFPIIKVIFLSFEDIKFQKMFIMTYRSFTTPSKLFVKLLQRYPLNF